MRGDDQDQEYDDKVGEDSMDETEPETGVEEVGSNGTQLDVVEASQMVGVDDDETQPPSDDETPEEPAPEEPAPEVPAPEEPAPEEPAPGEP
eukprot:CAMPEP_0174700788 /NCGR_PEP_ID=MMETSP1094-20130205/5636_1 /TAXON_ID=156173 /ORGANISM="Chrysochromulina brevifilum, Strain UTEX LB 985" /LENGTH=91 /DNA_ID=CAMNT_0015898331 /DNA_START=44 /DNA_END=315 /DNA_ORIENTATION=+